MDNKVLEAASAADSVASDAGIISFSHSVFISVYTRDRWHFENTLMRKGINRFFPP